MQKHRASAKDLTDEEVLKEFVKRFQCDGAVLIYLDSMTEFGFGRWCNSTGRKWVNNVFKMVKQDNSLNLSNRETEGGTVIPLSS